MSDPSTITQAEDSRSDSLEDRLYFALCAATAIGAVGGGAIGWLIGMRDVNVAISVLVLAASAVFWQLGKRTESPAQLGAPLILMVVFVLCGMWFVADGSQGSIPLWFTPAFLISTIMLRGRMRLVVIGITIAAIGTALFVEWQNPEIVIGPGSVTPELKFVDAAAALAVVSVLVIYLGSMIARIHQEERERVARLTEMRTRDAMLLEARQSELEQLRELLPICSHCRKIRDDSGTWHTLERYMRDSRGTELSHGICPDCLVEHY